MIDSNSPPAAGIGTGRHVLVVDDEPGIRRMLTRLLASEGFAVQQAASGAEALACLERAPRADLVITDVVMPGMNGHELIDRICTRWPDIRVMCMTGYQPAELRALGLACDVEIRTLRKPFDAAAVLAAVRWLLGE